MLYRVRAIVALGLSLLCPRLMAQGVFPIVPYAFETKALDTAKLCVDYELSFLATPSAKHRDTQRYALWIGNRYALGRVIHRHDPEHEKEARAARAALNAEGKGLGGTLLYTDRSESRWLVYSRFIGNKGSKYVEDIKAMEWSISQDTTTIHGYLCRRASGSFAGRDYELWFTEEIPIPLGPWKLIGLPGLVLRAKDSEGHYQFDCLGIAQRSAPICLPKGQYSTSTKAEVMKTYDRLHKHPEGFLRSIYGDRATPSIGVKSFPYNPIERN